jgi:2-polyprenyl-3-methyl-5-hydroxy-6-metoxy-1,4-benzoquinol methylase
MRQLLKIPAVYASFAGFVTGNGRFLDVYVQKHIRARSGDKILDIGCGPGSILDVLPKDCLYTGFDISDSYIEAARKHYGHRASFFVSGVEEKLVGTLPAHDLVIATGVLHHLPDDLAQLLLRIAWSNLKPGGRLVTSDGCFSQDQPRLNRWMVTMDRGEFVRPAPRYGELAAAQFEKVELSVHHDLLRIPYSHVILECTRGKA